MRADFKIVLFFAALVFFSGQCREPFTPPQMATEAHYLVVEGFINAGGGPTTFTLSRTRSIRDTGYAPIGGVTPPIYELGAQVTVEDDQGNTYNLPELVNGQYGGVILPIDDARKYLLHINTGDKEYVSSLVSVVPAPAIDSVYWDLQNDGVQVYFDSYNTGDVTRYYRWTYRETWEFHTPLISGYRYIVPETTVVRRTPEEQVHVCWRSDASNRILIGNTAKLSDNSLSRARLGFIPVHNEKLSVLYSTKVKVFSLSKDEFEFWQRMKKNTEEMGTIFAPQPSTVRGNIQCITDPDEPVIGYVGARSVAERRIFIDNDELPYDWNQPQFCELDTVPNIPDSLAYYLSSGYNVPLEAVLGRGGPEPIGYATAPRPCADCTIRGTTTKPPFWP